MNMGPAINTEWLCDTPVHSDVEGKLRKLLIELGNAGKILGIQICAYKDGEVIIDTAAGMLGNNDPRPVQPDSLFPVFSVTKGVTAGLLHWLVDKSKLKYEENISLIWPEFASNNKDVIKVHHVLNHTSGLHNAMGNIMKDDPLLLSDWNECLQRIVGATPESEPGQLQLYHYLSFGWLCGAIIERASGKKFQEILEEAFIHPLSIQGELYIGIPPGIEDRLAELTLDTDDLEKLSAQDARPDMPSSFQPRDIAQIATTLPALFNSLSVRRAIIPSANGHCSARALARYYAALVDCGTIPKLPTSKPKLGMHTHIPKFQSDSNSSSSNSNSNDGEKNTLQSDVNGVDDLQKTTEKLFNNPRIHDAFLGFGEYENFALPNGSFGLGFKRIISTDGSVTGFGHSGLGGSTGFCDTKNRFSIAITLNKLSFGTVTGQIIQLVCSELNLPMPKDLKARVDMEGNFERPLIN